MKAREPMTRLTYLYTFIAMFFVPFGMLWQACLIGFLAGKEEVAEKFR